MTTLTNPPATTEHANGFLSMSVTMDWTARYHGSIGKVFLEGSVPSPDHPYGHNIMSVLLDVDQAKALINELTEAVAR